MKKGYKVRSASLIARRLVENGIPFSFDGYSGITVEDQDSAGLRTAEILTEVSQEVWISEAVNKPPRVFLDVEAAKQWTIDNAVMDDGDQAEWVTYENGSFYLLQGRNDDAYGQVTRSSIDSLDWLLSRIARSGRPDLLVQAIERMVDNPPLVDMVNEGQP